MDAFKTAEIARLDLGGNERWQRFWEGRNVGQQWGKPGKGGDSKAAFELEKRYGSEVGEEWKERLGCEVEGKEFTGMPKREKNTTATQSSQATALGSEDSDVLAVCDRAGDAGGSGPRSQKEQNESFFARKGAENATRPEGLAPSQGGKYGGFGSGPVEWPAGNGAATAGGGGGAPGMEEFQKDPMAALTKGFGWFTGQVGKSAKSVNEGWIQPTAQKVMLCTSSKQ